MTVFTVGITFVIVWWLVLFLVLPFGVRQPDQVEPGHADGAPERPRLWFKAGLTTVIAIVLTAVIYVIVDFDLISFRPGP
jgi:predicted secreted protein